MAETAPNTVSMSAIDLQKVDASGAGPKVVEVYQVLKKYMESDSRRKWRERDAKCRKAAFENEMWDDREKRAMEKQGQPPVVFNKLVKGIQGSRAIATANKPEIKAHPVGSGDLYVADMIGRGIDYVLEKKPLGHHHWKRVRASSGRWPRRLQRPP